MHGCKLVKESVNERERAGEMWIGRKGGYLLCRAHGYSTAEACTCASISSGQPKERRNMLRGRLIFQYRERASWDTTIIPRIPKHGGVHISVRDVERWFDFRATCDAILADTFLFPKRTHFRNVFYVKFILHSGDAIHLKKENSAAFMKGKILLCIRERDTKIGML